MKKQHDIEQKQILYKAYLISFLFLCFFLMIIVKIFIIQINKCKHGFQVKFHKTCIEPSVGEVYDANDILLTSFITKYDVRIDLKITPKHIIDKIPEMMSLNCKEKKNY